MVCALSISSSFRSANNVLIRHAGADHCNNRGAICGFPIISLGVWQGIARTQSPLRKNYAPESPTFGVIAGVNPHEVQCAGLALGGPPCWSWCLLCQVSMMDQGADSPLQKDNERKLMRFCVCILQHYSVAWHVTLQIISSGLKRFFSAEIPQTNTSLSRSDGGQLGD